MRRTARLGGAAAVALALGASALVAQAGTSRAPALRQVMFVGNNWDGTASVVDARTFRVLKTVNIVPDLDQEMADIRSSPDRLAYYYAIQQGVGEGHDQFVDDMFTTADGRYVAVARPSLSDVAWIDLATGKVVAEAQMDGYRTDHMAVSPDGTRLLVSDSTEKTVHEYPLSPTKVDPVNPVDVKPLRSFPSGETPHESNYTKDGRRIFHASIGRVYVPGNLAALGAINGGTVAPVTDQLDAAVKSDRWFQIVDNRTFKVLQRWDMAKELAEAGYPHMNGAVRPMAVAPDERYVYLQVSFFHGLVEFDTQAPDIDRARYTFSDGTSEAARGRVTRVIPLPNLVPQMREDQYVLNSAHHGLAIDRTGRKLCVAGTMDDYAAIVHRGTFTFRLYRGPNVSKPYWAGNGWNDTCWVSMSGTDHVVVIDFRTERVLAQVPVGDPKDVNGTRAHPQRVRPGVIATSLVR